MTIEFVDVIAEHTHRDAHIHVFTLIDNVGEEWRFIDRSERGDNDLEFNRIPGPYRNLVQRTGMREFFKDVAEKARKAIETYKVTKGLKGSAKDTWKDILS